MIRRYARAARRRLSDRRFCSPLRLDPAAPSLLLSPHHDDATETLAASAAAASRLLAPAMLGPPIPDSEGGSARPRLRQESDMHVIQARP